MINLNILKDEKINMLEYQKKLVSRSDLFLKNSDAYLLTSVEKQSGAKIGHFVRKIKESAADTLQWDRELGITFSDNQSKKIPPYLDFYVDCPDDKLSEKSYKILKALNEIMRQGIKINLHSFRGKNDKFAVALNNLINNFQAREFQR